MLCLSIKQPWAEFILSGAKPVENRVWSTSYRGPILIHAGLKIFDFFDLDEDDDFHAAAWEALEKKMGCTGPTPDRPWLHEDDKELEDVLPMGAIVGRARIVDCVQGYKSPWAQAGAWHFVIEDARRCEPYKYRGALRLFNVPDNLPLQWKTATPQQRTSTKSARTRASAKDAATTVPAAIPTRQVPVEDLRIEDAMCAFRAVLGAGVSLRQSVLRDVSRKLGYVRMGPRIEETLRGHLRAAIRRRIALVEGGELRLGAHGIEDYSLEELRSRIAACLRPGQRVTRDDLIVEVCRSLGFARTGHVIEEHVRSAFNSAIRQGGLVAEGKQFVRRT